MRGRSYRRIQRVGLRPRRPTNDEVNEIAIEIGRGIAFGFTHRRHLTITPNLQHPILTRGSSMSKFPPASDFSRPLTSGRLDAMGCHGCGATHEPTQHEHGMFVHGRCHPGAGNDVCYVDGKILVACHECKKPIVAIAVEKGAS